MTERKQQIIAGPCALESRQHAQHTTTQAKKMGIDTIRMNLWKPRTKPGFEGVGTAGVPWVQEAAEQGMRPAMEVLLPDHVDLLMNEVLARVPHASLLIWLGSRNQNHLVQRDIGAAIAGETRVQLMVKNQPWKDEAHWKGIVEHVLAGGASKDQLSVCHRGFSPAENTTQLRNVPDMEMAIRVSTELGIPLILDPSHIGGRKDAVKQLIRQFAQLSAVSGQIIEVHPNPDEAKTDAKQQLHWDELKEVLQESEGAIR